MKLVKEEIIEMFYIIQFNKFYRSFRTLKVRIYRTKVLPVTVYASEI
jgi:hypothetical protein